MKLTLPLDPSDSLCRRLLVDGLQVGLVTQSHGGWIAGLWPVANRRPRNPFRGETVNQARLADLRFALCRRLERGGPWWTPETPGDAETEDRP